MYRAPTRADLKSGRDPDRARQTHGGRKHGSEDPPLQGPKERWRPKGTPLQVRRVGTMYRAPTRTRRGRANADLAASNCGSVGCKKGLRSEDLSYNDLGYNGGGWERRSWRTEMEFEIRFCRRSGI